jgi:hypothetical protein
MPGVMSTQQHSTLDGSPAEELSAEERERLNRLKRAIARGERSDRYPLDKRQDFIRWLINQGKLSEH